MTPDSENFEQLRKLLALKRHEMPPPGYFHGFSREVIVRIKAGEGAQEATVTGWVLEGSWLRRFWGIFEARPMLAGSFGVAVCGFFVAGALISADSTEVSGLAQPEPLPATLVSAAALPIETAPLRQVSEQVPSALGAPASTLPGGSLFDEIQRSTRQGAPLFIQTSAPGGN